MATATVLSILALALALVAAGISGVSLWFQRSPPDVSALKSRVESLDLDVTELADRVNHWMRRDSTRAARAGQVVIPPAPTTPAQAKAALRLRANGAAM